MREIIYGIHAVQALLERNPHSFREIYILKGREDRRLQLLIKQLEQANIFIQRASRQWLDKKVKGAVHQGIIALVQSQIQFKEHDLLNLLTLHTMPLLLVLDGINDPHNLGACLRCADATGVHAIIVPHDRSAQLNATAKKVASGAAETIPLIRVKNLVRTLRLLQHHQVWIVGAAREADNDIYQSKLTGPLALVVGAEGKGLRRLTREHCDQMISIPMVGTVSSLNLSVAAGVLLFEAIRQRHQKL